MKKLFTLIVLLILVSNEATAAAFTPPLHKGQLFLTLLGYSAKRSFDAERETSKLSNNGKFSKNEISVFAIYRFYPRWAAIVTGSVFNQLEYKDDFSSKKFTGLGDNALGMRYVLEENQKGAQALQAMVFFPLYSQSADPTPGNHQYDLELRYLKDFYQILKLDFISLELAYRYRTSAPSDQLRADLSFGKNYERLLVMIKASYIQGLRNNSTNIGSSNPNAANDFDLLKLGPGFVWKFNEKNSAEIAYQKDLWGRNTGHGHALSLSWWRNFE